MHKEDFERERERAAEKIDLLEEQVKKIIESQQRKEAEQKRQIDLLMIAEAEQKQKLAERFQSEIDEERKRFEKAQEDIQAKSSQVKQYKKQVDALQIDLKQAQEDAQHYKLLAKSQDHKENVNACTCTFICTSTLYIRCVYMLPMQTREYVPAAIVLTYVSAFHIPSEYAMYMVF